MTIADTLFQTPLPRHMESRVQRAARRHSLFVRVLRWLLPATGILILAGMVGLVVLFNILNGFGAANVILTSDGLVMDHPKLSGHDGDRSYQVTARRAIQRLSDPRILDLESIHAEIVLGPEEGAEVISLKGIYDNALETLKLYEGVQLGWSKGYTVDVKEVDIDLKTGALSSSDPISISSEKGRLTSGKVSYDKEQTIVRFTDGVKVTINPAAKGQ
ncbi:MAG: LPS export ABC transporter periplasmic protein LptC [Roseibium sp.]